MDLNKQLSYQDYKRLRSTPIKNWMEHELTKFLVLDMFETQFEEEVSWAKDVQKKYVIQQNLAVKKYNKFKFLFIALDNIFLNFYSKTKNKNKKNILFQNSRYEYLIINTKQYHHTGLITEGKKDRLFSIKNFMGYVGLNDLDKYILYYLKEKKIEFLYKLLQEVNKKIKKANPNYIILRDDCSPIARAITLVCRELGIPTAVIQHGLYDSNLPVHNCKAADYVLVWGKYFKDLLINKGIREDSEIVVLGYPYPLEKVNIQNQKPYKICYLGQDFERYNSDFLQIKLKSVKKINNLCKKMGVDFIYRPHPTDDRDMLQKEMNDVKFTDKGESLQDTIRSSDIFIGFSSTALVEASMAGKISLQLLNYPIKTDNFQDLGVCSKSFNNIVELENYLQEVFKGSNLDNFRIKFNNYYIETRGNLSDRFLEIINKIK